MKLAKETLHVTLYNLYSGTPKLWLGLQFFIKEDRVPDCSFQNPYVAFPPAQNKGMVKFFKKGTFSVRQRA